VVVLAGSLLAASERLLEKGIHPTIIAESFQRAAQKATELLTEMSVKVELSDRESLLRASNTSLNSKVSFCHGYSWVRALDCLSIFISLVSYCCG
jgi:T-complex protein 1 subunit delta